MTFMHQYNDD